MRIDVEVDGSIEENTVLFTQSKNSSRHETYRGASFPSCKLHPSHNNRAVSRKNTPTVTGTTTTSEHNSTLALVELGEEEVHRCLSTMSLPKYKCNALGFSTIQRVLIWLTT